MAELALQEAERDDVDVAGVLVFAGRVMGNAAQLWMGLDVDGKHALQAALFPEGLSFNGQGFGTPVTSFVFKELRGIQSAETSLASPTGFEPVS